MTALALSQPTQTAPSAPTRTALLPATEWTTEAHTWLSRAVTAEVGLPETTRDEEEQILLAYILLDRYNVRKARNPKEHFVDTVRAYRNGMKKHKKVHTPRMLWLRNLPGVAVANGEVVYPLQKPKHWPKTASWSAAQKVYGKTWVTMDKWAKGELSNPCPGAKHWGSVTDPRIKGMRRLKCSRLYKNVIYGHKPSTSY